MPDPTVNARFHGGPFDGETVPVLEEQLTDLVVLEATDDGIRLRKPTAEDDDHADRAVYRLSAEASGLQGDVEYVLRTPLDPSVEG